MHDTNHSWKAPGTALGPGGTEAGDKHRAHRKRGTVLLVDDEPAVLEGLRIALRKEPFQIVTAGSAAHALRLMARARFDAVVSDEQMPRMTGSELLSLVRRDFPDTIRIILTGQASLDAAIRAINGGEIYRFLTKPCTAVHLALTLRQALSLRAQVARRLRSTAAGSRQHEELVALERAYPGITQLRRGEDGCIAIQGDLSGDEGEEPSPRRAFGAETQTEAP